MKSKPDMICMACDEIFHESELSEPFGLSGLHPGCPYCGSDDLCDYDDDNETANVAEKEL